jgi:hypothetical protein
LHADSIRIKKEEEERALVRKLAVYWDRNCSTRTGKMLLRAKKDHAERKPIFRVYDRSQVEGGRILPDDEITDNTQFYKDVIAFCKEVDSPNGTSGENYDIGKVISQYKVPANGTFGDVDNPNHKFCQLIEGEGHWFCDTFGCESAKLLFEKFR